MTMLPLAFQMPGFGEMLLIAGLGLLFFGKRLPEVGRSVGRTIVEFKKGIKGIEDEVDTAASQPAQRQFPSQTVPAQTSSTPSNTPAAAYRFDPYTGKPMDGGSGTGSGAQSTTTDSANPTR
jgi:sec-independent protein translocase protein TatA